MRAPYAQTEVPPTLPPIAVGVITLFAAASLIAHVLVSAFGPYGIHRDALLYMAMGDHLRLWQMDFPPLIAIASRAIRLVFGDSIVALRMLPALASAGLIVIAGLAARELGGRRFAQALACLAVLASGIYLRTAALFQPVALDQLWWTLGLFCLLRLARDPHPRWWLAFGGVVGLGLLTKFSILIFGLAVLVALLMTPSRRWLATPWPWAAALIAVVLGSPSLVGQVALGFPLLDQLTDLRGAQLDRVSRSSFLVDQFLQSPGVLLAAAGAWSLSFGRRWKRYRLVGLSGLVAFAIVLLLRGKSYYIAPIYPVLFGAGAVMLQEVTVRPWGALLRWGMVGLLVSYLGLLFPLGLPILSPAAMEAHQVRLGLAERVTATNVGGQERIPQDYADMLGWPELVEQVAGVYGGLAPEDRARAVILASNYGEAGAIDFYGPRHGLPPARAFVGSYWHFGPGDIPGEVLILVGFEESDVAGICGSIENSARVDHPYAVAEQRDQAILICRDPSMTLQEFWPTVRGEN